MGTIDSPGWSVGLGLVTGMRLGAFELASVAHEDLRVPAGICVGYRTRFVGCTRDVRGMRVRCAYGPRARPRTCRVRFFLGSHATRPPSSEVELTRAFRTQVPDAARRSYVPALQSPLASPSPSLRAPPGPLSLVSCGPVALARGG